MSAPRPLARLAVCIVACALPAAAFTSSESPAFAEGAQPNDKDVAPIVLVSAAAAPTLAPSEPRLEVDAMAIAAAVVATVSSSPDADSAELALGATPARLGTEVAPLREPEVQGASLIVTTPVPLPVASSRTTPATSTANPVLPEIDLSQRPEGSDDPTTAQPGRLSAAQIYAVAREAGFTDRDAAVWTAIALAESRGNPSAHNGSGEDSWGLWQINLDAHSSWAGGLDLTDPLVNGQAAYRISRQGRTLVPWTVTHANRGAPYLSHLPVAIAAAIEVLDSDQASWIAEVERLFPGVHTDPTEQPTPAPMASPTPVREVVVRGPMPAPMSIPRITPMPIPVEDFDEVIEPEPTPVVEEAPSDALAGPDPDAGPDADADGDPTCEAVGDPDAGDRADLCAPCAATDTDASDSDATDDDEEAVDADNDVPGDDAVVDEPAAATDTDVAAIAADAPDCLEPEPEPEADTPVSEVSDGEVPVDEVSDGEVSDVEVIDVEDAELEPDAAEPDNDVAVGAEEDEALPRLRDEDTEAEPVDDGSSD